jgi:hypothetical protein
MKRVKMNRYEEKIKGMAAVIVQKYFLSGVFQYFCKTFGFCFISLILLLSFPNNNFSQDEVEVEEEGINILGDLSVAERKPEPWDFRELCKTPEGKQYIFDKENDPDLRYQWEGLRAQNLTSAATFEEFKRNRIEENCRGKFEYEFLLVTPKMTGTCANPSFGPPYFDVKETVGEAQAIAASYRENTELSTEERERRLFNAIKSLMQREENKLFLAYQSVGCELTRHAECWGHTGQRRTCGKTRFYAPSGQQFLGNTLEKSGNVYVGPNLVSPTYIWFRAGKTGHGMGHGYVYVRSIFTREGAKSRAASDVDAIRHKLKALKIPVDRIPEPIPERTIPSRPTTPTPNTTPANLEIQKGTRSNNKSFYDVRITNTGGSPGTINYQICVLDAYFTISKPRCERAQVVIPPRQTHENDMYEYTPKYWCFEVLPLNTEGRPCL